MALYGENLAKTLPASPTLDDLRQVMLADHDALVAVEANFSAWDDFKANGAVDAVNLSLLQAIDPASVDSVRAIWSQQFGSMALITAGIDASDDPPSDDLVSLCRDHLSNDSDFIHTVDSIFHTSVGTQLADATVSEVGDLSAKVANAVSKVAGNFLGGVWWIVALALGALVLWHKYGTKVLP